MPRHPQIMCPDCGFPTRRININNPPGKNPRTETIRGWVFCRNCEKQGRAAMKKVQDPAGQPRSRRST